MSPPSGTVVDSSVLLDVFTQDADWGGWSQTKLLAAATRGALVINAVVVAEIAPRFSRIEALTQPSPAARSSPAIHNGWQRTSRAPS